MRAIVWVRGNALMDEKGIGAALLFSFLQLSAESHSHHRYLPSRCLGSTVWFGPLPVPYEIERHEKYWVDENDSDRENFSKPFRYIPHFNTHEGLRIFEKCQMLPLPPPRAPTLVNSHGRFDHAAAIVRHKHETGLIGESSSSRNSSNDDMIKGILGVGTRRDARGNVVGASGAMPSFSTESQVVNEYLNEALERGDLDEALHILLQVPRRRDYVEWREF